jgi:hypothetical protein
LWSYYANFSEISEDGCGLSEDPDINWLEDVTVVLRLAKENLFAQVEEEDGEDHDILDCSYPEPGFTCDIELIDDQFREDEGFEAVMRKSIYIEGEWLSDSDLEGMLTFGIECVGDDCEEAIDFSEKNDTGFNYPSDLPCESLLLFTAFTDL